MKLTLYKKMLIGFAVVIFLTVGASVYVIFELRSVTSGTKSSFSYDLRAVDLTRQMKALLYEEEPYAQKAAVLEDKEYYKVFEQQSALFKRFADSLESFDLSPEKRQLVLRIQESHGWFSDAVRRATFALGRRGEPALAEEARSDTLDVLHGYLDLLNKLNQASVQTTIARIDDSMLHSSNVAYLLTVGAFLIATLAAVFMTRRITKPIGTLIRGTEEIAQGRFKHIDVNTHDEMAMLAHAVNDMSTKLESIDKLKTEMMHHISHELRTPLQAMTSAVNLLSDQRYGTLNAEQMRLTAFIREGINKINAFSHEFLDISKIESGAMKYTFVNSDLLSLLLPVVEEAKLIALRKNIVVTMDASPIAKVRADIDRLPQVFSNLLSNAIKYTPENGSIHIVIGQSKFGISISVTDTGVGIEPEDLPNIFKKFYQAKNVKKASARGTGVGLALAKAIVEAHGGRVFAESVVGEGTTFTVELPAVKEHVMPDLAAVQQSVN